MAESKESVTVDVADNDSPAPVPTPKTKPTDTTGTDTTENGECGPACLLSSQARFIVFICILVCIILLLLILFGCYFMKKLHGKAILTTNYNQVGQDGRNSIPKPSPPLALPLLTKELPNLESWKLIQRLQSKSASATADFVQKKTIETRTIGGWNEPKETITTTTTNVVQAVGGRLSDVPL